MFLYFKIMFHYSGTILDLHSVQFIHSVVPNSLQPHALQGFPGGTSPKEPACQCRKVKSESEGAQLCPTLCDPMDCSPPGSSVHGIFQPRVLEWGASYKKDSTLS